MFWGISVLRKLCRLRIIAKKPEGVPPVMNDLVSARHLPCVVERKTLSKDSSHAHWWRRFGAPSSTPLIGSDCTFLRLLRWGIYGWVGSFPLSCQTDFPLSVSGLAPSLCQVSRQSYHPRCHPLPAWGRVWIEMTLGKKPNSPQVFFAPFACEAAKQYHGLPRLSDGLGVFCVSCLALEPWSHRQLTTFILKVRPADISLNIICMVEGMQIMNILVKGLGAPDYTAGLETL